jgi:hypothetical protein
MEIRPGDRVLVNLAPFIGSPIRSPHVIPCRVITFAADSAVIQTEPPYRAVELSVLPQWVERHEGDDANDLAATR